MIQETFPYERRFPVWSRVSKKQWIPLAAPVNGEVVRGILLNAGCNREMGDRILGICSAHHFHRAICLQSRQLVIEPWAK